MSDVQITIGANATQYEQAMSQVKATAARTSEAIGIEGLKGERALRTQITGFFRDIASGSNVAQAAVNRLGESFRMSAGALVAFVAVQYLFDTLKKGYDLAATFKTAVQDSLSINTDNSVKSIEQLEEEVDRLKKDSKDEDLGAMSSLEAGATVFVQVLEDGKSITDQINEDGQKYRDTMQKMHGEQDAAASRSIEQENEILQLRIDGNDAAAEALKDEYDDRNKLLELQRQGDTEAIQDLQDQIALKEQLREKKADTDAAEALHKQEDKVKAKINETNLEAARLEDKANYDRLTSVQKIAFLEEKIAAAKKVQADSYSTPLQKAQARLIVAQSSDELVTLSTHDQPKNKRPLTPQEMDEMQDRQAQQLNRKADLTREAAEARSNLTTAQADAMTFHGQVSSLRKVGFGRAPAASSHEVQALRAAQQAVDRLDKVERQLKSLNDKIGGAA